MLTATGGRRRCALLAIPAILFVCGPTYSQTIFITPKNGVPSAWELVTVEPDRIVVRKGGARFEFSKEQIETVTNPEASQLVENARKILDQVEKYDPKTFSELEPQLERMLPPLDAAARKFVWVLPDLVEVRDRTAKAKEGIEKTLDVTMAIDADLGAIERMASGRSPVATNWEEVVDSTLNRAKEIPFEQVQKQIVDEIEKFRRTIRLSLVRRTEETETRVRTRGESLLAELERGEIDEAQWSLVLRDLRRQVSEQVPDPDLRLELESFLNGIEQDSQSKLEKARSASAIREIRKGLTEVEKLTLDASRTEEFKSQADLLSTQIAELPETATRENLTASLQRMRSDHEEALARLQRPQVPEPEAVVPANVEETQRSKGWEAYFSDWRILVGGTTSILVILGLLQLVLSRRGKPKSASQIEDLKTAPLEAGAAGWAGGQEDLMSMLGGKEKTAAAEKPVFSSEPEVVPAPEEDPFGLASPPAPESTPEDLFTLADDNEEDASEDPFGFSGAASEVQPSTPTPSAPKEEDPFGVSSPTSLETPKPSEPTPTKSDDLFGDGDDPLGLSASSAPPEDPGPMPAAQEEEPFDLFSPAPSHTTPDPEEERIDDLFGPVGEEEKKPAEKPDPKAEEEDIFGFGSYFESDEEKER